jgi:SAM-dependent methyltransferase
VSLPLACPVCGGELDGLTCASCGVEYAASDGIPLLVPPGSDVADLWEEAESGLSRVLRENPELERALLSSPPAELAPADAFLRALVLEERGDGAEFDAAFARLYPPETLACIGSQIDALCERVLEEPGLVVDLASGRGVLLQRLQRAVAGTLVATDVSPRVLRRARRRGIEAIACDVRRLPFADGSVDCATTFLGLNNVEQPGSLLAELRRVAKRLLAVHLVYEPGTANDRDLQELELASLAYREPFVEALAEAGWRAEIASSCTALLQPTPVGVLLEGAVIDRLPVEPVEATWLTIDAR